MRTFQELNPRICFFIVCIHRERFRVHYVGIKRKKENKERRERERGREKLPDRWSDNFASSKVGLDLLGNWKYRTLLVVTRSDH